MAGLVPAIPILGASPCPPKRDRRDKPGDDDTRRFSTCLSTDWMRLLALRIRHGRPCAGHPDSRGTALPS